MKAKWKLVAWILAPFLLVNILYSLWIPRMLEDEAWRKGRELSTSEAFSTALRWYLFLPWFLLRVSLFGGIFFQVIFALLLAVWVGYFVKFHAEYMEKRRHP